MSPLQPPVRQSRPFADRARIVLAVALAAIGLIAVPRLPAQRTPTWIAAGAAALTVTEIADGRTGSVWQFGKDPMMQWRGSIERSGADGSSLGVVVGRGIADLSLAPLSGSAELAGDPLPATCRTGCLATLEVWSLLGQIRTGTRATGFHTFFEAQGGVTGFRALRTRMTNEPIGPSALRKDLTGTLGAGFGYALSRGLHVALVQDYGIGWHDRTGVPEGTGRTWRIRSTRASLRFAF